MDRRPTATKRYCGSKRTRSTRLSEGTVRRLRIPDRRLLAPGHSAVLFVWLSLNSDDVPRLLMHRIGVTVPTAAGGGTDSVTVDGLNVTVASQMPRIVGPPLEGDHWLAANGPDNNANHRRTLLSLTGEAHIAQRFAIDWVRLYDDGRTFRGDPLKNSSYRAFGANVLAVGDGIVVDAADEIPENVPDLVARAVTITPRRLVGNFVLLDIGDVPGRSTRTYSSAAFRFGRATECDGAKCLAEWGTPEIRLSHTCTFTSPIAIRHSIQRGFRTALRALICRPNQER
jgi:hypothetical protein